MSKKDYLNGLRLPLIPPCKVLKKKKGKGSYKRFNANERKKLLQEIELYYE